MPASYLEEVGITALLPESYKNIEKVERSIYQAEDGKLIAIIGSKIYDDKTFWYSCVTDYFSSKGITVVCLVAGFDGILLVPVDVLKVYGKHCGWKQQKKGRSYYVRVKRRDGRYLLFCSEGEDIDITEYFLAKE